MRQRSPSPTVEQKCVGMLSLLACSHHLAHPSLWDHNDSQYVVVGRPIVIAPEQSFYTYDSTVSEEL